MNDFIKTTLVCGVCAIAVPVRLVQDRAVADDSQVSAIALRTELFTDEQYVQDSGMPLGGLEQSETPFSERIDGKVEYVLWKFHMDAYKSARSNGDSLFEKAQFSHSRNAYWVADNALMKAWKLWNK